MSESELSQEDKEDKKVTLTVSTLSGDFTDEYGEHRKLEVVIDRTVKKLKLTGDDWVLEFDGHELNPEETVKQAGLKDGDVLTLNEGEGGGGSRR